VRRILNNDITIIFLGAGASQADGAPLQNDLFREYFKYNKSLPEINRMRSEWDSELNMFFKMFYGIDIEQTSDFDNVCFPTFEEVLGVLEIAISQEESFKNWDTSSLANNYKNPRLPHIHSLLILLIAEIIAHKLEGDSHYHPLLVNNLKKRDLLEKTSFISLNYDILIDNTLMEVQDAFDLDYTVDFVNPEEFYKPREKRVKLFKLHGSLNWLYCPTCRSLRITPKEKGVCKLKYKIDDCVCDECNTLAIPIIIPPTYFKALSNLYLRQIWNNAEIELMKCNKIVFCGYSFPDADIHIRYLLKRIEVNMENTPEIFIVNNHSKNNDQRINIERERYMRFFKDKQRVNFTELTFQQYAENPSLI